MLDMATLKLNAMQKDNHRPSVQMLNYAHNLAESAGMADQYDWTLMTKQECSAVIERMKVILGMDSDGIQYRGGLYEGNRRTIGRD